MTIIRTRRGDDGPRELCGLSNSSHYIEQLTIRRTVIADRSFANSMWWPLECHMRAKPLYSRLRQLTCLNETTRPTPHKSKMRIWINDLDQCAATSPISHSHTHTYRGANLWMNADPVGSWSNRQLIRNGKHPLAHYYKHIEAHTHIRLDIMRQA